MFSYKLLSFICRLFVLTSYSCFHFAPHSLITQVSSRTICGLLKSFDLGVLGDGKENNCLRQFSGDVYFFNIVRQTFTECLFRHSEDNDSLRSDKLDSGSQVTYGYN